jgi:hypothetical protein
MHGFVVPYFKRSENPPTSRAHASGAVVDPVPRPQGSDQEVDTVSHESLAGRPDVIAFERDRTRKIDPTRSIPYFSTIVLSTSDATHARPSAVHVYQALSRLCLPLSRRSGAMGLLQVLLYLGAV